MTGTVRRTRAPLVERLRAADPLTTLAGASLLALLVVSNDDAVLFAAAAVACAVALPRPILLRNHWLWTALFGIVGLRQLSSWHTIDDHTIAMTYWCGALAIGLPAADAARTLASSGRLLIGSLFAFAAGWKLLSGQFADGTFFRYSLLFDDRFEVVADVVGGTSSTVHDGNVDAVSQLVSGSGDGTVILREGSRNELLAQAFTWWGIVIESAVALAFLVPLRERWGWLRHATLLAFAGTTYLLVPIGGFATVLFVLASAMVTSERARLAYYAGAAALFVWSGVWPLLFDRG